MTLVRKYLFIALLLISAILLAQQEEAVLFDRISSEQVKLQRGLSQNNVYCIIQDETGFMWFGTWDGLNKYDGNKFTIYNRTNGLVNETIYSLAQTSNGRIWIGTEDGLNTFDPRTGEIRTYIHDERDTSSLSNDRINCIYEDKSGMVWVGTARGINLYNAKKDSFWQLFTDERDNTAIRNNWVNDIYQDKALNYWFASRYGLIRYHPETRVISRYYHKPGDPSSLCSNFITSLCEDNKGNLWIGTNRGLSMLDYKTKQFTSYYHDPEVAGSLSDNTINDVYLDHNNRLWVATNNGGLNLFDADAGAFIHFEHNPNKPNSLSNNRVYTVYQDQAGALWVGTFKGISKIDTESSKFVAYRNDPAVKNSLSNNFIRDIIEFDETEIWIATDEGINVFNEKTELFSVLPIRHFRKDASSIYSVRDMYKEDPGHIWIGTGSSGMMLIDSTGKVLKHYKNDPRDSTSLGGNQVVYLLKDRRGDLWAATNNGLSRMIAGTDHFVNYNVIIDVQPTEKFELIYDIHELENGEIWFASQNGLTQYFPENDSFATTRIKPERKDQVISNKLFSIKQINDSIFWLGTRGGGLVKYNRFDGSFEIFTEKDGLPNNVIYGFLVDPDSNYWISTNWGLSKFNPENQSFVNYDIKDGLQGYEFNGNAMLKTSSGKMYFGGMNGFNCFYPREIKTNKNIPPVVITGFNVFNKPLAYNTLQKDTLFLEHDDNFFSFEFAALDYTNPSKNKYRYKLQGVDETWRETDASYPEAEYTEVSPGTYTFEVIGSNNDGYWNREGDQLTLVITPAWWNSWAFRIPFLLIVIGLITYFIYYRFKTIKNKHAAEKKLLDIEKQMFDIEQKALQLQMNPHFIFNSLNSIQSFVIKNDKDKAINYLAKFSQLMRLILANSRETYVPVKDELTALKYYMDIEKLRFDNKFDSMLST